MTDTTRETYPVAPIIAGSCLWCGETLEESTGKKPRKYCSRWCTNAMSHFNVTGRIRVFRERVENTHCLECGKALELARGNRNPKKFCNSSCSTRHWRKHNPDRAKAKQSEWAKQRAKKVEAAKPPKPRCKSCGAQLYSRRRDSHYCGNKLCQSVKRQDLKLVSPECSKRGCSRPSMSRGLCGSHAHAEWAKENPDKAHANKARYRARKRGAWVENVDRAVVFERDRWVCGICGERIPKSAIYPDLLSPSIDHVIPLAEGGEHSYANVQAAHFSCNSSKQNRGSGEQLAII